MHIRVDVLGRFRVVVGDRTVPAGDWRQRRSADVLKLLALASHHRLHREQIMDALWPDLSPEAAAANLRKAIHFARRTLGHHDAVVVDGESVALAPDGELVVDAELFEAEARSALRSGSRADCARAADRYGGDLLPDERYTPWTDAPRERLRLLLLELLRAAGMWERILEVEPADEEAHRALMQAALEEGRRGDVIRHFEKLRERLRVDLGLGPDAATTEIYERALALEGGEPPSLAERVRAMLAWGIVHLNSGDLDEAERTAERARAVAIDAALAREVGEASALLGLVAHMQGRWPDLFRSEFVASVRRTPDFVSHVFDGHLCLAEFCLCGAGGHEEVAGYARELLAVAEDAGSVHGRALATLILGEAALFSGTLTRAEELLTDADRLLAEVGAAAGRALAMHRRAEVAIARGRRWQAARLVQRGTRLAEQNWLAPHLLVRFLGAEVEAAPDAERASAVIRRGDKLLAEQATCQPCSMGFRVASSIAQARAGEIDRARRRLDDTERLAGMWQGGPWLAAVWEARGVLRQVQGEDEQAAALFREAAERFESLGRPRDQARCLAQVGT